MMILMIGTRSEKETENQLHTLKETDMIEWEGRTETVRIDMIDQIALKESPTEENGRDRNLTNDHGDQEVALGRHFHPGSYSIT